MRWRKGGEDASLEVHRFSLAAFEAAKAFSRDEPSAAATAKGLQERLPDVVAKAQGAAPELRPDLNRVLSDARLDLAYVLAGGGLPTSIRFAHFQEDRA